MSPRERRVTDKQEPRFHRKHGRVLPFDLTLEQGNKMSNADEGKSAGKSGQRRRKGESKKAEGKKVESKKTAARKGPPDRPAPVQVQSPEQDQPLQPEPVHAESPQVEELPPVVDEPVVAVAAEPEPPPAIAPSPAEPAPAELAIVEPATAEPARAETAIAEPTKSAPATAEAATAELSPVSLQTIANAYRDYTRKSFEEFGSFFEQLSGARSLEKAMSVHSEFVKRAYETSIAESQKICELHSKLARQTFQPLQGLVGKTRDTRGKS
ncbi:MAG TPA: phasin family protein [Bradyrhizobium sp.]